MNSCVHCPYERKLEELNEYIERREYYYVKTTDLFYDIRNREIKVELDVKYW